jgi:lipid A oxidase
MQRQVSRVSVWSAFAVLMGLAFTIVCSARPAIAEVQLGVYGGMNSNFTSPASLHKGGITDDRTVDWEGRSFEMPPYWGVQAIYWSKTGASWGWALDYIHTKAYANLRFASDLVYSRLEFTDGNNLLLLSVVYRSGDLMDGRLSPYIGIGGGIAIPHVEVSLKAFPGERTWEYQIAGGAVQGLAGLDYRMSESWSLFAQARLSYSHLDTDLAGGGQLKTYLWTPQLAVGVAYRF